MKVALKKWPLNREREVRGFTDGYVITRNLIFHSILYITAYQIGTLDSLLSLSSTTKKEILMLNLKTLPSQNGNSCAAHCTEIAVSGFDIRAPRPQSFVEDTLWRAIKWQNADLPPMPNGVDHPLVAVNNSSPMRVRNYVNTQCAGRTSRILYDATQKDMCLQFAQPGNRVDYNALFTNLIQPASNGGMPRNLLTDTYYNCAFMMFRGPSPGSAHEMGFHNILVAKDGATIKYYNPNEDQPVWRSDIGWRTLRHQNAGRHSYVWSGIAIEIT
ncbi:hypothetical protein [Microbulbifer sp. JMSA003]|uniref:hypothetical protein n=1 Tax=Microbulbifer sp. JMSA003 TaxID=3243369 RepID=UPI0040390427